MAHHHSLRLFVAFALPVSLQNRLSQEVSFLQLAGAQVRWVPGKNMHLTLRFLGDVRADEIVGVTNILDEATADLSPARLLVGGIKTFPLNKAAPRAITADVRGQMDPLHDLYNRLQRGFGGLGFKPESKGWNPHVTIGRVRGNRNIPELMERVADSNKNDFGALTVNSAHLMMSDTEPEGPIYNTMQEFRFGGHA